MAAGKRARRGCRARFATTHARSSTRHRFVEASVSDPDAVRCPAAERVGACTSLPLRDGNAPTPRGTVSCASLVVIHPCNQSRHGIIDSRESGRSRRPKLAEPFAKPQKWLVAILDHRPDFGLFPCRVYGHRPEALVSLFERAFTPHDVVPA